VAIALVATVAVFFYPPIPQDPAYHLFADSRALWGVPNFWNVVSNVPFIAFGFIGILLVSKRAPPAGLADLRSAYLVFFVGISLIGFGSIYYHLTPSTDRLVWDRLPMTISFMAFFSVTLGEHISPRIGHSLLWPLVAMGVGSVMFWYWGEVRGTGDLRPYALVQFLPMLLIPVVLLLFQSAIRPTGWMWAILLTYSLSKLAELGDPVIFQGLGWISGHSLKHLIASLGALLFLRGLWSAGRSNPSPRSKGPATSHPARYR